MNHNWINKNYNDIMSWAKNISKGDQLAEELAHYSIETFMNHKRYDEICQREREEPNSGHCRGFILAIMRNSWWGAKSEFTRYHKAHRADLGHRKRTVTQDKFDSILEGLEVDEYNYEEDRLVEAVEGLLEEMNLDTNGKLWYNARLFQMWIECQNYSELSRRTDIPRTSISNAVEEAKHYIVNELKNRGII